MQIVPPPLIPGDAIAVIAPAGLPADRKKFHIGCAIIEEMGFKIINQEKQWPGFDFFSDRDECRLRELHQTWADPEVKAIIALRGGFGSLRLAGAIDYSVMRENPKLFIGFSDISILLNLIYLHTGLIGLHGPVLTSLGNCDKHTIERLYHCLTGKWYNSLQERVEIIRGGPVVKGRLLGGNLCSLLTMFGTPVEPQLSGAVLLLEEVNEPLYRLDRLLTQLHLSGKLDDVAGIILGDFSGKDDSKSTEGHRRKEFVWKRVCELTTSSQVPVWGDFPAGHCQKNMTLPVGAQVLMDSSSRSLSFIES
jgi:muramoyltetrapeptide carboxypeptidase